MKFIEVHPLGFTKVNLLSLFGFRVRLHVWRNGGSGDRHNHRWSFVSLPLWGTFVDARWAEVVGDSFDKTACHQPSADRHRRYEPEGQTSDLALAARFVRRPLLPYVCRRGAIHSYRPAAPGFHASLVFLGRARSDRSTMWSRRD